MTKTTSFKAVRQSSVPYFTPSHQDRLQAPKGKKVEFQEGLKEIPEVLMRHIVGYVGEIPFGLTHASKYFHEINCLHECRPTVVYVWSEKTRSIVQNLPQDSTFVSLVSRGKKFHLHFSDRYNETLLPKDIPEGITHLTLGWMFNQPLAELKLSNCVTHITFGFSFNQEILPGDIPEGVTQITLQTDNREFLLPGVIPNGVRSICFI